MPAAIRSSGQMWNRDGELAGHQVRHPGSLLRGPLRRDGRTTAASHGAFDPATMGTTPNVGLMAQKAEEYGSHDKTFEISAPGTVRVVDGEGETLLVTRRRSPATSGGCARPRTPRSVTGSRSRSSRARADRLARRVLAGRDARPRRRAAQEGSRPSSSTLDTDGPADRDHGRRARPPASRSSAPARGENTISVTGNVLRDYLTDLFPILELGTSAKMLSIVPLMDGGGLFETGRRRLGAQARPAVPAREPPALGLARGVPGAGGVAADARRQDRQRAGADSRRHAGPRHRRRAGAQPLAVAQGRRARQPRQPLLPGALLGPRARRSDRGRRAGQAVRPAGGAPRGR